ncbi:MAG: hypothetical protein KIT31_06855 [Deltaproteobacteria bacterium]|nr:hypothetical protein [Deltaproteobacteria bacterium]
MADRVAEIEALIAAEPEVVAERTRLRYEHDELVERIDRLEVAEAEAARGGGLRGLLRGRRARAEEAERRRAALVEERARLEEVVAAEREVAAKLAEIERARREAAGREVSAIDELRAVEGPEGDALRAVDAAIAEGEHEIGKLSALLAVAERAADAVRRVAEARENIRTLVREQNVDAANEILVALGPMLEHAREQIARYQQAPWTDAHGFERPPDVLAEVVEDGWVRYRHETKLARAAGGIATALEERVTALFEARRRLETRRASLEAYQRELAARSRPRL